MYRKPPEGWYQFGSHVDIGVPLEFSKEHDEAGMPLWEKPDWSATSFKDTTECAIHYALVKFTIELEERKNERWGDLSDIYIKYRKLIRDLANDPMVAVKYLREYE